MTKKHFPNIYEKCLGLGIDITRDYIPVAPAAHYLCGGIKVDLDARSSINRLYAVGECACTGLHGGNRLASNSLIEAVVYADAAAKHSLKVIDNFSYQENHSRMERRGDTIARRNGTYHSKRQRSRTNHEYLCRYRSLRPAA